MGLETVVVAFFVIGMIVIVACTLTAGANHLIKSTYEGYTAFSQTTMDRLHTDIKVNNITFDKNDSYVTLTVVNTGETKLSNFKLWDIIVADNSQTFYISNNERWVTSIGDIINPGILDPHESMDMRLSLPESNNFTGSLLIKVITENGIASSADYTVS